MKLLLDSGIFIHSEFAEDAQEQRLIHFGNVAQTVSVHGFMRKKLDDDSEYQEQKNALFTIGRLIREGRIDAYDYIEIIFERMRGISPVRQYNALQECKIHRCPAAVERSKFRQTINLPESISKGGKKDRDAGNEFDKFTQIAFFEWLCGLNKDQANAIIQRATFIGLTAFEIESLEKIEWFQFLCRRSNTPENYPDIFHLWTAERNGLDAVLTLEKRLPNLVSNVRKETTEKIEIQTEVLRPLDLLKKLGIDQPDPVPIEPNRFYSHAQKFS